MSMFNHNSRRNCFGSGVIFAEMALMALMATAASAATINYSTYVYSGTNAGEAAEWNSLQTNLVANPKVQIAQVIENSSGNPPLNPDVPLLNPLIPSAATTANGASVAFKPTAFVQVDTSGTGSPPFDIKTKTSNLTMLLTSAKNTSGSDPDIAGYAIDNINLQLSGLASVQAPFYLPPTFVSAAYARTNIALALTLTQLNFENREGGALTEFVSVPLTITNMGTLETSTAISTWETTVQATASGGVSGSYEWETGVLSWDSAFLRNLFGVTGGDQITEISLGLVTSVTAAGIYGEGSSGIDNINASVGVAPVAVPEPPTIILAGLGAVAVVANGYRRRKQRSQDSDEGDNQGQAAGDLNGAIALTA